MFELCVSQKGIEDAQVGVPKCGGGEGQVKKIADHDVDEDSEVVSIEVFVGGWCGKEKVEELEDEKLKGGLVCSFDQ